MRSSRRTFIAHCLAAGAAAVTPLPLRAAGSPIKIGAPGDFTGALASVSTPILNGEALKVREINAAGGLLGRTVQLVSADMASSPAQAPAVARELLEKEKVVALVGFADSDAVLALAPQVAGSGLPFVTPGATSPLLPRQVGPTLYLACFGDNAQAAAGAEFLYGTLGARRVHLLHNEASDYTRLLAGYFKAAFEHLGGDIATTATYKLKLAGTADDAIALIAAAPPADAVFLAAQPEEAGGLIARLRAAGVGVPIVGGDGYDTPLLLEQAGAEVSEVYYSTHVYMGDDPTPRVLDFMSRYWSAYGYGEIGAFAALGYDALGLLADAIARAGSTEPKPILDALAKTQGYPGITGTISYAPGQQVPEKSVSMIALDKGKHRLAAELTPAWVPPP